MRECSFTNCALAPTGCCQSSAICPLDNLNDNLPCVGAYSCLRRDPVTHHCSLSCDLPCVDGGVCGGVSTTKMTETVVPPTTTLLTTNTAVSTVSNPPMSIAEPSETAAPKATTVLPEKGDSETHTSVALVGGILGGVCVLCLIVGVVWLMMRSKRRSVYYSGSSSSATSTQMQIPQREDSVDDFPMPATVQAGYIGTFKNVEVAARDSSEGHYETLHEAAYEDVTDIIAY